jgi:hypothetical protein
MFVLAFVSENVMVRFRYCPSNLLLNPFAMPALAR